MPEVLPIKIDLDFTTNGGTFDFTDWDVTVQTVGGAEPFAGPYVVTPEVTSQTLQTKAKYMTDNVTILEIPYHEVSNQADGTTVIIGGISTHGV